MPDSPTDTPLRWAIYCRVVDNFGDVGMCWRLAAELGARGHEVRLVIDDDSALVWLAPHGARGVTVVAWPDDALQDSPVATLDVVIEAFGCHLPRGVVGDLVSCARPPVWINLEYLSAERFAEETHGLSSPQFGPDGRRVDKRFFYPGFTDRSGGLIREAGLMARRTAFARDAWLGTRGLARAADERVVSLFCYENAALDALLTSLSFEPTLLLATAGPAQAQVERALGPAMQRGALRAVSLPLLGQADYDHLLWSCDLNFVRGEDSFVRAHWAGAPFVWQAYPQHDGVHVAKVDAFLDTMGADADVRALFQAWNGGPAQTAAPITLPDLPDMPAWRKASAQWQRALATQPDLVTRLVRFVVGNR